MRERTVGRSAAAVDSEEAFRAQEDRQRLERVVLAEASAALAAQVADGAEDEMLLLRDVQTLARAKHGMNDEAAVLLASDRVRAAVAAYKITIESRLPAPPVQHERRWDRGERLEAALRSLVPLLTKAESPAEEALLFGFLGPAKAWSVSLAAPDAPVLVDARGRALTLDAQVPIADHRIDFILAGGGDSRLAIEVDGFEHHERTQEQAERDRARDRALLAEGVETIRFMAKAVFADPGKCAAEAFTIGMKRCSPFVVERTRWKR